MRKIIVLAIVIGTVYFAATAMDKLGHFMEVNATEYHSKISRIK